MHTIMHPCSECKVRLMGADGQPLISLVDADMCYSAYFGISPFLVAIHRNDPYVLRMQPGPTKIRLFSTITPIQPGVLTMVDLGDTSSTFAPFVPAQPAQLDDSEYKHHIPSAKNTQDATGKVVDLRSLGLTKGEPFSIFGECRLLLQAREILGDEVDKQETQRKVRTRIARVRRHGFL